MAQNENVNRKLLAALELMLERIPEPPKANCNCHLSPPCNDCVDYGGEREAFEFAKEAIVAAETAQPLAPSYDVLGELDRIIDELENGFVACERCGDQEDTATLDVMPHLRVLRDAIAQPAAVPDGWKLVPVEPTDEMLAAGSEQDQQFYDHARFVYRAMLAAAPKPEGGAR